MLTLEFKGKFYSFRFSHFYNKETKIHATKCTMIREDGIVSATASAICSPRDTYDKLTGRKVSLKKTLDLCKDIFINKEERKLVWKYFFWENDEYLALEV